MISGQERFIIIENDEPQFVVLSLEEYKRLVQGSDIQHMRGVNDQLQGIAQDIGDSEAIVAPIASGAVAMDRFGNELHRSIGLEDLPL